MQHFDLARRIFSSAAARAMAGIPPGAARTSRFAFGPSGVKNSRPAKGQLLASLAATHGAMSSSALLRLTMTFTASSSVHIQIMSLSG